MLGYRGFWKIAGNYLGEGLAEMRRSLSRRRFAENARRLIPALQEQDIRPGPAGVRAQALTADGKLVDDFHFVQGNARCTCAMPFSGGDCLAGDRPRIVRRHLSAF